MPVDPVDLVNSMAPLWHTVATVGLGFVNSIDRIIIDNHSISVFETCLASLLNLVIPAKI